MKIGSKYIRAIYFSIINLRRNYMNKNRVEENILKIPLVYNIVKSNLQDNDIKYKDIEYGNEKRQYYRVFNNRENSPIVFFVHGGSWWHGSPKRYCSVGKFFYKKGYTVVLVAYRLVPFFIYPTQIEDVFSGFKHFLSNKDIKGNKDKISVIGFSAGGELAANLVFNKLFHKKYNIDQSVFKKFISLAGVLDFEKCDQSHAKRLISNYLGNNDVKDKNPVNLINGNENTPVLCIHGDKDSLINVECSKSFISKLGNSDSSKLIILKNMHHSDVCNLIRGEEKEEAKLILDFLK